MAHSQAWIVCWLGAQSFVTQVTKPVNSSVLGSQKLGSWENEIGMWTFKGKVKFCILEVQV